MKFSVLMSIYYKEIPEYFERAMKSIWDEQFLKPNQIVLVQDGPLSNDLSMSINKWKLKLGDTLTIIALEKNVGLGSALNIGLKHCVYNIIARMDTDDISRPDRFKIQLSLFEKNNIDIQSSWVGEFDTDENNIISYRKVAATHKEIIQYIKKRNPLNHPSVMFKKASVLKVGGYQDMIGFEDYYLWVRMMMNGAKFYNIQEPLVYMRAGFAQLERRGGIKYALNEIKFQNVLFHLGLINPFEYIRNISIRFTSRVMPRKVLAIIYKVIRTR